MKVTKFETFKTLANIAKQTKDEKDIQIALRYGIENRISVKRIRENL